MLRDSLVKYFKLVYINSISVTKQHTVSLPRCFVDNTQGLNKLPSALLCSRALPLDALSGM